MQKIALYYNEKRKMTLGELNVIINKHNNKLLLLREERDKGGGGGLLYMSFIPSTINADGLYRQL